MNEPNIRAFTLEFNTALFSALFVHRTPGAQTSCLLDRLHEIRCPVLLVWGEEDRVVPVGAAQAAVREFPDASLLVVPDCGHAPQIERPAEFLGAVAPFLNQHKL